MGFKVIGMAMPSQLEDEGNNEARTIFNSVH